MDTCVVHYFAKPNYLLSSCVFVATLLFAKLERATVANVATATATSRSVGLQPSEFSVPGLGTFTVLYTTFDGSSTLAPLADLKPGSSFVSGELRPRFGEPLTYEVDYFNYSSQFDVIYTFGFSILTLPANDTDGNTIPDIFQFDRAGAVAYTGFSQSDSPSVTKYPTEGIFAKEAGTRTIARGWSVTQPDGTVQQFYGTASVGYFAGNFTYTRSNQNSQNQVSLRMEGGFSDTQSVTYTGSTSFSVVNANQISFPQFTVTRTDGFIEQISPFSLSRKGNRYTGEFEISDGNTGTYWRDYTKWVFEITDTDDSDRNGVPDFSDVVTAPVVSIPNISSIIRKNQSVVTTWTGGGTLQSALVITGPWVDVTGATSPKTNTLTGTQTFYRIKK